MAVTVETEASTVAEIVAADDHEALATTIPAGDRLVEVFMVALVDLLLVILVVTEAKMPVGACDQVRQKWLSAHVSLLKRGFHSHR